MKTVALKVTVPDVKFNKDDIVQIEHLNTDKSLIVMIDRVLYYGNFMICKECGKHVAKCNTIMYNTIAQPHSWDFTETPMRPGKIFQYTQEQIDGLGKRVMRPSRIVQVDSQSTILDREKVWRNVISKIRNGDLEQFNSCI